MVYHNKSSISFFLGSVKKSTLVSCLIIILNKQSERIIHVLPIRETYHYAISVILN